MPVSKLACPKIHAPPSPPRRLALPLLLVFQLPADLNSTKTERNFQRFDQLLVVLEARSHQSKECPPMRQIHLSIKGCYRKAYRHFYNAAMARVPSVRRC